MILGVTESCLSLTGSIILLYFNDGSNSFIISLDITFIFLQL